MSNDYSNKWPTFYCPPAQVNPESALEFDARLWAAYWHRGQVRKYTAEPYVDHPAEVVALVRTVPHTQEMLAAAWLHDVIEDCGVSWKEFDAIFPEEVQDLVMALTDISTPEMGNRALRKKIDLEHLRDAVPEAKTIKLADIISNSKSILERDPDFSKVYLPEKRALLEVLKEGDPTLWKQADEICRRAGY